MTPDQSVVATAVNAWKIQIDRADRFFSGLSEAQLFAELAPGKNRLFYLWGHLAAVHDGMLPLLGLGERLHPELDAPFLHSADRAVTSGLPSAAEVKQGWDEVNARLLAGFATFTTADWAGPHTVVSEADFAANPLRNRLSVLLSRTGHIAYHLGQAILAPK